MIYIIHTYTLDNYVIQNLMKLITYNVLLLMYLHLIPRGTTFCSYSNLRSFRKKLGLQYDEDVLPVTHPHHIEDTMHITLYKGFYIITQYNTPWVLNLNIIMFEPCTATTCPKLY